MHTLRYGAFHSMCDKALLPPDSAFFAGRFAPKTWFTKQIICTHHSGCRRLCFSSQNYIKLVKLHAIHCYIIYSYILYFYIFHILGDFHCCTSSPRAVGGMGSSMPPRFIFGYKVCSSWYSVREDDHACTELSWPCMKITRV
jgi:hypothetical protein